MKAALITITATRRSDGYRSVIYGPVWTYPNKLKFLVQHMRRTGYISIYPVVKK